MNKKVVQELGNFGSNRLDLVVAVLFDLSRNQAQKAIKSGEIYLNGARETSSKAEISEGDAIEYSPVEKEKISEEIPVIYEDEDLLVINKPSGITVHPAPGETGETVIEYFKDKLDFNNLEERDGVVHRLDKGTSGLMVIAKNAETEERLQSEFQERKVQKTYLALIEGAIEPEEGEIDIPVGRDERNRERMAVTENGKPAQTEYKTLKKYKNYSLLELKPKTGRTHQIRVHLSAIGHPILGDVKYGGKQGISLRIFLHAAKLTFSNPRTGQKMDFEANLPEDLEEVLASLD